MRLELREIGVIRVSCGKRRFEYYSNHDGDLVIAVGKVVYTLTHLDDTDARLLVADRYSGSFAAGGYLGVYSRMQVTWRLTVGEVDNGPEIILLNRRDGSWEIEGIVRLDIAADGRIDLISDYQHCPWTLTAGSIVVTEPAR